MFWDQEIKLKARGGGCLHSFYCWKKLCRARLSISAQMLESGNSLENWILARNSDLARFWCCWWKLDPEGDAQIYLALCSCSLSYLETGGKLPPYPSPWWQLPRKSRFTREARVDPILEKGKMIEIQLYTTTNYSHYTIVLFFLRLIKRGIFVSLLKASFFKEKLQK